jgi:hypothetical protein
MLRGYRRYFITIAGLFVIGASQPKNDGVKQAENANPKIEQALADLAVTVRQAHEPSRLDQPCKPSKDNRHSDLCAQWKAADAAASAARATWWFGALGTLAAFFTLCAAIAAAVFARRAVNESRRIGEAQVRAYLTFEKLECRRAPDGVSFKATVKNSGSSPALAAQIIITIIHKDGSKSNIEPLEEHTIGAQSLGEFAECFWLYDSAIDKGVIIVEVAVGYADVFGGLKKIHDRFALAPVDLEDKFTQMVPGRHIASYIRASQSKTAPIDNSQQTTIAEGHNPSD